MLAVKLILEALESKLANENVQWFSDNVNVARIIEVGNSKEHLQLLAIDIFGICLRSNINLFASWIPREQNATADFLSKINDTDNWSIDTESFLFIQKDFGTFTIDRFADDLNKKCDRFNSKYFCSGSESVNAFSCDWSGEFNWFCLPIRMVGDTLKHAKLCRADGVLLVPLWTSSYFWPLLSSDGEFFDSFVKSFILLDPFYINNTGCKSVFNGFANFYAIAMLLRFP